MVALSAVHGDRWFKRWGSVARLGFSWTCCNPQCLEKMLQQPQLALQSWGLAMLHAVNILSFELGDV